MITREFDATDPKVIPVGTLPPIFTASAGKSLPIKKPAPDNSVVPDSLTTPPYL